MIGVILAISSLFLGLFLQKAPGFPRNTASRWVQAYLINMVLPALALLYIPEIKPSWGLLIPISAAWFTFLGSWALFGFLGKKYDWGRNTTGCLIIVAGLANTSFLGFPVIEGLYGKAGLPTALLIDQGGSFLIVSSLSILVGSLYGNHSESLRKVPLKILKFPPFGFLIGTLIMSFLNLKTPELLIPLLQLIGKTMPPMALLAIGLKFTVDRRSLASRFFWYGLGYRLILAPAVVWMIYRNFLPADSLDLKVTVLESGMAPMITGSIVAMQFGLQPRLATLLSGLGMPISAISLLIWYFLLG
ncbi:MAG: AEC family transporter [Algoriphagus sp.]|uniref:AEC family transporter n=1 Tax=Algoriphagus sp. TaxID=1872435 RepID=UPI00272F5BBD|nr:AEC family transporter [Algoriphagus sp.]MDP2040572.1 AEC family transporter [Algoriphagus sp.]MDP3473322.1 AEC family transporter [Algoriphagus sp.]